MKDSGIEWIGKIPQDWDISRLKFLTSYVLRGESPEYAENAGLTKVVNQACIYWDGLRLENVKQDVRRFVFGSKGKLESGDLLMNSTGTGTLGRLACFDLVGDYIADSHVTIIRTKKSQLHPVFLKYLFSTNLFQGYIYATAVSGSTNQIELSREKLKTIPILLPPISIQAAQVEFLDTQTSNIDHAIEQKRKLIDLLKEKRAAIINRAVTRGLDDSAELVESCVEWIGKAPKVWKMRKIAQSFNLIGSGSTPASGNEAFYEDGEINWIITGDLNDGTIHEASKKITKEAFASSSALKIYPRGTLLIAMYGATIGKVALIDIPACTNQACCALSDSPHFENKFVYYWFLINRKNIVDIYSYGSGQPNISQDTIKKLHIPAPSRDEQRNVIAFLDSKMNAVDQLILKVERSIGLLAEYRTSLISHVVTGKVEI